MKQGKIDVFEGIGRILGPSIFSPMPGTISVELASGEENEMLIPKCTYCNRFSSKFITRFRIRRRVRNVFRSCPKNGNAS